MQKHLTDIGLLNIEKTQQGPGGREKTFSWFQLIESYALSTIKVLYLVLCIKVNVINKGLYLN